MTTNNQDVLKTGTTTIGIVCKDGIILGADKRATAGNFIVDNKANKILEIADNMAITLAGLVSDAQLLTKLVKAEIKLKDVRTLRKTTVKEAGNLLSGIVYGNIRKMSMLPGVTHFLLGGVDDYGNHLFDIFADGSFTEIDKFVASGSGSVIAYGVLETLWKDEMTLDEGVKLVRKAINAALQRDSASGSGIDVLTISKNGGLKKVVHKDLRPDAEN